MLNTKAETLYDMLDKEIDKQIDYRISTLGYDVHSLIDKQIAQMITDRVNHRAASLLLSSEIDGKIKEAISDELVKIELSSEDLKYIRDSIKRNFKDELIRAAKDKLQEKVRVVINAYEHNILTVGRNRATLEDLLNGKASNQS